MSLKLETVLQLASSPGRFLKAWKSEAHQIPKHTPSNIHGVELHEGDWESGGSIKFWQISVDGKRETVKEKVEVDEANKTLTFNILEGDVMQNYKVFKPTYKLEPNGQGTLATLIIEYEKANSNVPAPDNYLDFMVALTKDIDAALVKA